MLKSTVYHADQSQELSGAQEGALLDAEVIALVGENLGHFEYVICTGFAWADVDAVLARLAQAPRPKLPGQPTCRACDRIVRHVGA